MDAATEEAGEELLYAVRDGIGRVTLNRPHARNALTFAMYERLEAVAREAGEDPAVRVLLVTGAGDRAFAAGTDIAQFRAFRTAADALAYEARIGRVLDALEACPKPTIAAVAGACTGGGLAIAATCDLRIGADNARFGMPVARTLGNCLAMGNYARLAALLGPARVLDLVYTARLVEAPEAVAIGLLGRAVPLADLPGEAEALARTVAGHAPLTLRATKEAMRRLRAAGGAAEGDDLVTLCFTSADFREGVDAFLAKRPPRWEGR